MLPQNSGARWQVVLLAALRLASLYAIAVALLLLPPLLWYDGPTKFVQDLKGYTMPVGVAFAVAFGLLVVARRAGFVALWVVLGGLWALILREAGNGYSSQLPTAFLLWSAFALPLGLLGGLGVPAVLRISLGRWKPNAVVVALGLWAALLVPALALFLHPWLGLHPLQHAAIDRMAGAVAWFVWAPGPPLIAALSGAHVWTGTAQVKVESAAA